MFVTELKSNSMSGGMNSMSKATICCLRWRRWVRRKSWPLAGLEVLVAMRWEAETRERVVEWTMRWARSSKTLLWTRR